MNENEKYFLNSSHAALSSFQSSGRITRLMRKMPHLGIFPNLLRKLLISLTLYDILLGAQKKKKFYNLINLY